MEPKEKIKFLEKGKKVKLKSLDSVDNRIPGSDDPGIAVDMRERFGGKVTVSRLQNNKKRFEIEEDEYIYHIDWVDDYHFISLPQELFEIQ